MKVDCKGIDERLLDYVYEEMSAEDRRLIESHLEACPACREEVQALASTRSVMSELEDASPQRDDSFVLQVAAREAAKHSADTGGLGFFGRLGKWFGERPGLVAAPMAGVVVLLVVGVGFGDNIRSMFSASANALAGEEVEYGPTPITDRPELQESVRPMDSFRDEAFVGSDEFEAAGEPEPTPAPRDADRAEKPLQAETKQEVLRAPERPAKKPAARRAHPPPQVGARGTLDGSTEEAMGSLAPREERARHEAEPSTSVESARKSAQTSRRAAARQRRARSAPARSARPGGESAPFEAAPPVEASKAEDPALVADEPLDEAPADPEVVLEDGASSDDRSSGEGLLEEARRLYAQVRCEQVLSLLDGFVSPSAERTAEGHVMRARCLERLGRIEEARSAWESALRASPGGRWSEEATRALEDQ